MLRMLKTLPLLMLAGFAIFATSCGTDHSQVRLLQASSDAGSVDVAVDGKTVVTNLGFGNVSPASGYLTVTAGNRKVEVRPTGTTADLINSNVSFASGKQYTTIVSGFMTPPQNSDPSVGIAAVVLTDDSSAPASGNVKLRVVHDAPGNGIPPSPSCVPPQQTCLLVSLDVYIVAPGTPISGVSPTISSLAYGQASSYQSVTLSNGQVQVIFTLAGDKNPVINQTYTLSAGQIRTLVTVNVQGGLIMATTPLVLNDLN